MENDIARQKAVIEIESPYTPIQRRDMLVQQLYLYDLLMGYKRLKNNG